MTRKCDETEKRERDHFFAKRVLDLRDLKGRKYTQGVVAKDIGISEATIRRAEAGVIPSNRILKKIAAYFGVTVAWLLAGEGETTASGPPPVDPQTEQPGPSEVGEPQDVRASNTAMQTLLEIHKQVVAKNYELMEEVRKQERELAALKEYLQGVEAIIEKDLRPKGLKERRKCRLFLQRVFNKPGLTRHSDASKG